MTTKNAVGNSLTGSTGSGQFVGDTSPAISGATLSGSTALGTPASGTLTNCTSYPGVNRVGFRATQASPQSISSGSFQKINFDTETWDTASYFDNATNYRYTPLVAGKYRVSIVCGITALPAGSVISIAIYKNGSLYNSIQAAPGGGAGTANSVIDITDVVSMNGSTDYLEAFLIHDSGSNKNTLNGAFAAEYVE